MPQTIKLNKRDALKLNLMVVGESGLGKTTFLQSLLGRYVPSIDVSTRRAINEKTNHISQIGSFEIMTEPGDMVEVVTFDSPGYGDFINNQECVDTIKSYIKKCHEQWRNLEPQSMTEAEFYKADNRIHCVFYFIGPHRMKMLDREFIAQLAPLVPIIPVIAKADTMTVKERNEYLSLVKAELEKISEKLGESCIYDFQNEDLTIIKLPPAGPNSTLKPGEIPRPIPPSQQVMERLPNIFAVVCDLSQERAYPWGTLRIDDSKHSDFRRLQAILFESENHLKGLIDMTRLKTIRLCGKNKPKSIDNVDHHFSIRFNSKSNSNASPPPSSTTTSNGTTTINGTTITTTATSGN